MTTELVSPAIDVGASTPASFPFSRATRASVVLAFFADAGGTEAIDAGIGSRVVTATLTPTARIVDIDMTVSVPQNVADGILELLGGTPEDIELGTGSESLTLTSVELAPATGALSYRYIVTT